MIGIALPPGLAQTLGTGLRGASVILPLHAMLEQR